MSNQGEPFKFRAYPRKSNRDYHLEHVSHDPDFKKQVKTIMSEEYRAELAPQFAITPSELDTILAGKYIMGTPKSILRANYDTFNNTYEFKFSDNITVDEYRYGWEIIKKIRSDNRNDGTIRKRAPENSDLIYAIFKAKKPGITFSKIFKMYSNGELPKYNGSITQFKDEDSLEKYYHKYRPDKNPI